MTSVNINRVEMWRIWQASGRVVVAALVVTAFCGWAILLWHHPGWIIGFGTLLGLILGTVLGGMDILSGSEEFALSLPTTRRRRYLLRAGFGGGVVLALTTLSTLAIGLDLPQRLWGLVVESGFTEPFGPWENRFLVYGLAVTAPLLVFAGTFVAGSLCRGPVRAMLAWIPGLLAAGAVIGGGALLGLAIWGPSEAGAGLGVPLAGVAAVAVVAGGKALYERKEGVSREGGRGGWGAAAVVVIAVVVLFLVLAIYWTASPSEAPQMHSVDPPTAAKPAARYVVDTKRLTIEPRALEDKPTTTTGPAGPADKEWE